jgi:hypothetical protein
MRLLSSAILDGVTKQDAFLGCRFGILFGGVRNAHSGHIPGTGLVRGNAEDV